MAFGTMDKCLKAQSTRRHRSALILQRSRATPARDSSSATTSDVKSDTFNSISERDSSLEKRKQRKQKFVPQKAAVKLTKSAREFFWRLLDNKPRPEIAGIMLKYEQSKSGDMRMVFTFDFVTVEEISHLDEPVSLEVLEDGSTPKPYGDSVNDGLPKLYVKDTAFLKVLGATVDIDTSTNTPVLYDRDGHLMDPNA